MSAEVIAPVACSGGRPHHHLRCADVSGGFSWGQVRTRSYVGAAQEPPTLHRDGRQLLSLQGAEEEPGAIDRPPAVKLGRSGGTVLGIADTPGPFSCLAPSRRPEEARRRGHQHLCLRHWRVQCGPLQPPEPISQIRAYMDTAVSQGETHHLVWRRKMLQTQPRRGVVLSVGVVITVDHVVRSPGTFGPTGRTRPPVPDAYSSTGGTVLMNHACSRLVQTPQPPWSGFSRSAERPFGSAVPRTVADSAPMGGQS